VAAVESQALGSPHLPADSPPDGHRLDRLGALLVPRAARETDSPAANALITVVASLATGLLVWQARPAWHTIDGRWWSFAIFVVVTFGLQLVSVQVYDRGAFSFAGSGMLALGFSFGLARRWRSRRPWV
jgi:hypothetical protein